MTDAWRARTSECCICEHPSIHDIGDPAGIQVHAGVSAVQRRHRAAAARARAPPPLPHSLSPYASPHRSEAAGRPNATRTEAAGRVQANLYLFLWNVPFLLAALKMCGPRTPPAPHPPRRPAPLSCTGGRAGGVELTKTLAPAAHLTVLLGLRLTLPYFLGAGTRRGSSTSTPGACGGLPPPY